VPRSAPTRDRYDREQRRTRNYRTRPSSNAKSVRKPRLPGSEHTEVLTREPLTRITRPVSRTVVAIAVRPVSRKVFRGSSEHVP